MKINLFCKKYCVLALACLLLFAAPSFANVTYLYTGNAMETIFDDELSDMYLPQPLPTADPVLMSLTFSDNGNSLVDWSVSQTGLGSITMLDTKGLRGGLSPLISLKTTPSGEVDSWYVSVYTPSPICETCYSESALSYKGMIDGQPLYPYSIESWDLALTRDGIGGSNAVTYLASKQNDPGTWTSSGTLPSLNYHQTFILQQIPEPETYAMLLAGLGLFGFIAHRRKTKV